MHAGIAPRLLSAALRSMAALLAFGAAAAAAGEIRFSKTRVDPAFRAEGVAVADIDGDGKKDIAAGPFWYRAPDWKPHEICPPKEYVPLKGYSDTFACFAEDVSGDGRPDLVVVGFPGEAVRVYENPGPGGFDRHWKEHRALPSCSNESPAFFDIDRDGRRDIVSGCEPEERMAWSSPGEKISDPWRTHVFSGPKAPGGARYYHGLGIGDLDLDGRFDVVTPVGWYEGPQDPRAPDWRFHAEEIAKTAAHSHILVHDFDGDGDQDLLMGSAHGKGIWWYEQTRDASGARRWTERSIDASYTQTHAFVLADLDGDGLQDFVTGKRWMAHMGGDPEEAPEFPAFLFWYRLEREAGRPKWTRYQIDDDSGVGTQFEVTDVNGDGQLDVVVSNKKGVFYFEGRRGT